MVACLATMAMCFFNCRGQDDDHPLVSQAKDSFGRREYREGRLLLDSLLASDSMHVSANYLMAQLYLLYADTAYLKYLDRLQQADAWEECDIIRIREAMLLGDETAEKLIEAAVKKYPRNADLEYVIWLNEIDKGGFAEKAGEAAALSEKMVFSHLPYEALFYYSMDIDPGLALAYLDTLESIAGEVYHSRNRPVLELLTRLPENRPTVDEIELEYADCGPGMGFYMTDSKGQRIKVELDTGTSGGLFTIHSDSVGRNLAGKDTMTIEEGISYNYMEGPEDMHYKLASFSEPPMDNFLIGYFKGSFTKADGCFSPFIFKAYALSMDPVKRTAFLRTEKALDSYLAGLDDYVAVDFVIREGWIYIPCKINGREVLMMIETGSRYVNLNDIAAKRLGVEPYASTIKWRGQDYPVEKIDFTMEIGRLKHEIKGGMVSSFILGNTYYGLASAGDIGPDFLRNYAFTIDPFRRRLIIEIRGEG